MTGKEKAALRGAGQSLEVRVRVGRGGIDAGVRAELRRAFATAELVKVRVPAEREGRERLVADLEEAAGAACVGSVGHTVLLHRLRPEAGTAGPGEGDGP